MKNAELIVRMLEQAGVRWAFGVPSGPVLPLIEAIQHSTLRYVLTASETTAAYMAATVGGLTGAPGVCISTLGPGATNLATGVGGAFLDCLPMLAVTCNVATPWLRRRTQMRIDHHALFAPITKASFPMRRGYVAEPLAHALNVALSEPPGPVHLDLPEDVSVADATEAPCTLAPHLQLPDHSTVALARLEQALRASRRPLVVTGLGFTRCRERASLLQFVEKQRLPYVTTAHAKGFLPERHANWVGVIGRARRSDVQRFVERADLIVAVGYDPVEINYEEWVGDKPVIHLSCQIADTGPGLTLLFNEPLDLDCLVRRLPELPVVENEWDACEWEEHRAAFERALRPPAHGLGLAAVLDVLARRLPADGILAYDVGAHHHQIASQWRTDEPWNCLSTNGWSSMGIAMPAAYAAKLVYPERAVVALIGDGCFHMTAGELNLARRLRLAVPHVVLNDGWLSLIKVKQLRKGYARDGVFLGEPVEPPSHYFGVPCRPARDEAELGAALDWALNLDGPSVIEAAIDAEPFSETVYD